ncbi:MAG: YebC/PmpR family DNA-binding transcriptional regulator [Gemmatimonadetes bacterium]|nr:YebC/PmpR family DNA-binding transcriptional regulator [Gemmatimonadota bacterium]
MAGHSKWAQIKRKKAANDARRGQAFTKLIREIAVAAREAGGDPNFNPRLRLAVDTARAANMPNENIERAIKRGTGELAGAHFEEVTYEGYGPGGVALYIQALTDNLKRTVADIRHILEKHGGNLGQSGSVAWQFDRKGQIYLDAMRYEEDAALEAALDAGAEDLQREDEAYIVTTDVASFHAVQEALRRRGIQVEQAELAMVPRAAVHVEGAEAQRLLKLLEALEDADDVQKVYSNLDVDEATLAEVAS